MLGSWSEASGQAHCGGAADHESLETEEANPDGVEELLLVADGIEAQLVEHHGIGAVHEEESFKNVDNGPEISVMSVSTSQPNNPKIRWFPASPRGRARAAQSRVD